MRRQRRLLVSFCLIALSALAAACGGGAESSEGNPFVSLGAEDAYQEGIARYRVDDYPGAEAAFRQALAVNPRYLAAYLALGRTLNDDDRPTEALSVYGEAVAIRDRSGEAYWGRAAALLGLARYEEAIEAANAAVERGYREDAVLVLALAYEQIGDVDSAVTMIEEALRTSPGRSDLRIQLSRMYFAQGRAQDAVPLLERAAFSDTSDLVSWTALAALYSELDQYDRAIEAWQQVARIDPGDAYPLVRQGEAQLMVGNHMVAIQALGEAISMDSSSAEAYVLRGKAQVAGGFLDRALADAERALDLDPQSMEALDLVAEIHARRGSVDEAIAAYEAILRSNPQAVGPAVALARIHLENDDPAAALATLESFEGQATRNPTITETLFAAHQRMGNSNEALGYLLQYVGDRPNDPILLLELVETALAMPGQTRLSTGELVEHAERAFELSGGFRTEYRIALIDALIADGQRDRALEETSQALIDVPNNLDLQQRQRDLRR